MQSPVSRMISPLREMYRLVRCLGASTLRRINPQAVITRGNIEKVVKKDDILFVAGWLDCRLQEASPTIDFGATKLDMLPNALLMGRRDVNSALGDDSILPRGILYLLETSKHLIRPNVTIKAAPNFHKSIAVEELSSWHKVLCAILQQLSVGSEASLYNIPECWFPILTLINREMTLEEVKRKRVVKSERPKSKKPAASVIFVQCGPVPLLPFCFPALSMCGCELELILVNNSAHLRDHTLRLLLEAKELYGLSSTYIEFENNIGFGNACNVAADLAEGELLLFHNNDVLPTSPDDYRCVLGAAGEGSLMVGARQFFPRGDIMHDGIRIGVLDANLADGRSDIISGFSLGRGIPPARLFGPILASGSLMCLKSSLFRSVEGFSSDYLFGHFEDLDLCLRLHQRGVETRIANTNFIHSEGGGSEVPEFLSRTVPLMNRRIFTTKWRATMEDGGA
jgi:GT2 family glycosyltransferase